MIELVNEADEEGEDETKEEKENISAEFGEGREDGE